MMHSGVRAPRRAEATHLPWPSLQPAKQVFCPRRKKKRWKLFVPPHQLNTRSTCIHLPHHLTHGLAAHTATCPGVFRWEAHVNPFWTTDSMTERTLPKTGLHSTKGRRRVGVAARWVWVQGGALMMPATEDLNAEGA